MPGPAFLRGERVVLRTVEAEDVPFLQAAVNDPDVRRYIGVFEGPYDRQRFEGEWLERMRESDGPDLLVTTPDDDPDRLGNVSLAPLDERRGWANLGAWIHPDHWGEGYATEASALLVDHGFAERRLHRVSASVDAPNDAARRVLERLGFVHEGTRREDAYVAGEHVDREVYGLLRSEWEGAAGG